MFARWLRVCNQCRRPGDGVRNHVHEVGHPFLRVEVVVQLPQVVQHVVAGLQNVLLIKKKRRNTLKRIRCGASLYTGCSLNIVFFPNILEYSGLWPSSVFPRCQNTGAAAELAEFRKTKTF